MNYLLVQDKRLRHNRNCQKWRDKHREHYRTYHREYYNKKRKNQNLEIRKEIEKILGDKCFVCSYDGLRSKRNLSFHEIHGKPHSHTLNYILKHRIKFEKLLNWVKG